MQSHCRQVTNEALRAHAVQHTPDLKWSQRTDKVGYWHWIIEGFKKTNCRELQTDLMILVTSWLMKKQQMKFIVKYTTAEKMRKNLILHSQSLNLNHHWTWKITVLITMKMLIQWLKLEKNKAKANKQNQTKHTKTQTTTKNQTGIRKSSSYREKQNCVPPQGKTWVRCFWFSLSWEDRTE